MKLIFTIIAISFLAITAAYSQIGVNLDSHADYSPQRAYCDLFKTSRVWGTAQTPYDNKGIVDQYGNPSGDNVGTVVFTGISHPTEAYKLKFKGQADIAISACACSVTNKVYDLSSDTTTADITVQKDAQLFLSFRNMKNVRELSLVRPECKPGETFHPTFLESLKPFKAIRFMDFTATNNSLVSKWSERRILESIQYTGSKGAPWEVVIELANLLEKDVWVNLPALADDDYIQQLATLLKSQLKPHLTIYVEHSNETWNSIFKQYDQAIEAAKADIAAGDLTLREGNANQWHEAWRWHGKQTWKISKIFGDVFGRDHINKRVRVVLGEQAAYSDGPGRFALLWGHKNKGPVSSWLYASAIAPYFACCNSVAEGALTKQMLIDGVNGSVESNAAKWDYSIPWDGKSWGLKSAFQLANYLGIKVVLYESGMHIVGRDIKTGARLNVALKKEFQFSPEMGAAYEKYYSEWVKRVGTLAMHFGGPVSNWTDYFWGLKPDYETDTPKYQAVLKIAGTIPQPPPEQCVFEKEQIISLKEIITQKDNELTQKTERIGALDKALEQTSFYFNECTGQLQSCTSERSILEGRISKALEALR